MGNQPKHDMQAGWHVKKDSRRNLKSTYGYFVDTIADENNFIQRQTVTVNDVHDIVERDTLLLGDITSLYTNVAYSSKKTRYKLERFGISTIPDNRSSSLAHKHPLFLSFKKWN